MITVTLSTVREPVDTRPFDGWSNAREVGPSGTTVPNPTAPGRTTVAEVYPEALAPPRLPRGEADSVSPPIGYVSGAVIPLGMGPDPR